MSDHSTNVLDYGPAPYEVTYNGETYTFKTPEDA
jgi:hypothetical protein